MRQFAFRGAFVATLLAAISVSNGVYSAEVWLESTITGIYPLSDGRFVISVAEDSTSCTSTSDPDFYYVAVGENGMTPDGLKNVLAAALAAAAQRLNVSVAFDDSTSACYVNRIWVSYD